MPRKPRFVLPGAPQHVIQRGHNREPCFYAEENYRRYLSLLDDFKNRIEQMTYRQVRRGQDGRPGVEEPAGYYYVV